MKPKQVYLALGTNIGDRLENLRAALYGLPPLVLPVRVSKVYETPPWGILDQPAFLNMVAEVETHLSPPRLLIFLKSMEQALGRVKVIRNGPRLIDLDILFYEDQVLQDEDLEVPHPRMVERGFVLVPLADLRPDIVHPRLGERVSDMLAKVDITGINLYPPSEGYDLLPKQEWPEIPQEMIAALENDPEVANKFFRLPPAHQREVLGIILEAVQPETRHRRIEKVISTLSQRRADP